mmetsp:Transcript_7844/g.29360  ORF Transcript_7844/g.29360 Transcript_7844/m.29360 type:complete len:89 (+) Transcript_7844:1996-2262(+)
MFLTKGGMQPILDLLWSDEFELYGLVENAIVRIDTDAAQKAVHREGDSQVDMTTSSNMPEFTEFFGRCDHDCEVWAENQVGIEQTLVF